MQEQEKEHFLSVLQKRFEENMHRHPGIRWEDVYERLICNGEKLEILYAMEKTAGEPDVVLYTEDEKLVFFDCMKECADVRRSLCYDREALLSRKSNRPVGSVLDEVERIGAELLDEHDYFHLQSIEDVDLKTSCWLLTPVEIRSRKGAVFGDKRYGRTFIYHNGAESYYSSRGFRTKVSV